MTTEHTTITSNYTNNTDDQWNSVEEFITYGMWAINGCCSVTFLFIVLGLLLPTFKMRKRLLGIRLLVFISAINRPLSKFVLPASLLNKIRAQQMIEYQKKNSDDGFKITKTKFAFPTTTMKIAQKAQTPVVLQGPPKGSPIVTPKEVDPQPSPVKSVPDKNAEIANKSMGPQKSVRSAKHMPMHKPLN